MSANLEVTLFSPFFGLSNSFFPNRFFTWKMSWQCDCSFIAFPLKSEDGTPLHVAALYGKSNIVKLLLQSGENLVTYLAPLMHPPRCLKGGNILYISVLYNIVNACTVITRHLYWNV
jgi:ankyrin repeat protein